MPYIEKKYRTKIDSLVSDLVRELSLCAIKSEKDVDGFMNYAITRLIDKMTMKGYINYEKTIGLLECIQLEYYRRVVGEYEDEKCEQHGEVYE